MESLDITNLIRIGQGLEAFNALDKFSSEDLASMRNRGKSVMRKLKKDSNDYGVLEDKGLLIKFMVNARYSDNGISETRISTSIQEAIDKINQRQE